MPAVTVPLGLTLRQARRTQASHLILGIGCRKIYWSAIGEAKCQPERQNGSMLRSVIRLDEAEPLLCRDVGFLAVTIRPCAGTSRQAFSSAAASVYDRRERWPHRKYWTDWLAGK
jgi:hypothetical protein